MKFVITSGVLMFEWTGMVCTHIDLINVSKANIIHVVHIINQ